MDDLIEALQIFRKYDRSTRPTNCDHDIFRVSVDPAIVSKEDTKRLAKLGFEVAQGDEWFTSYRFGSN